MKPRGVDGRADDRSYSDRRAPALRPPASGGAIQGEASPDPVSASVLLDPLSGSCIAVEEGPRHGRAGCNDVRGFRPSSIVTRCWRRRRAGCKPSGLTAPSPATVSGFGWAESERPLGAVRGARCRSSRPRSTRSATSHSSSTAVRTTRSAETIGDAIILPRGGGRPPPIPNRGRKATCRIVTEEAWNLLWRNSSSIPSSTCSCDVTAST
jgi:hypothetical protein